MQGFDTTPVKIKRILSRKTTQNLIILFMLLQEKNTTFYRSVDQSLAKKAVRNRIRWPKNNQICSTVLWRIKALYWIPWYEMHSCRGIWVSWIFFSTSNVNKCIPIIRRRKTWFVREFQPKSSTTLLPYECIHISVYAKSAMKTIAFKMGFNCVFGSDRSNIKFIVHCERGSVTSSTRRPLTFGPGLSLQSPFASKPPVFPASTTINDLLSPGEKFRFASLCAVVYF